MPIVTGSLKLILRSGGGNFLPNGIETFGFKSVVRLVWWSDCYEEWKPIVDWATDMKLFLKLHLEK